MKSLIVLCVLGTTLACCATGRATLLTASATSDTPSFTLDGCGSFIGSDTGGILSVSSTQSGPSANLQVTASADTAGADPTLGFYNYVNNDTLSTWNSYSVSLSMAVPFTILESPSAVTTVSSPSDWTTNITQPTSDGSEYTGLVSYQAGTLVGPGGELDFNYTINFTGSSSYGVDEVYTAGTLAVPEPGTLGLLFAGLSVSAFLGVARARYFIRER